MNECIRLLARSETAARGAGINDRTTRAIFAHVETNLQSKIWKCLEAFSEKNRSHHQAFKLDEVKEALQEVGLQGITVTEAKVSAGRRVTPSSIVVRSTSWTFTQGKNRDRDFG